MPKNGLKIKEVSEDHFSSGKSQPAIQGSRCILHLLEAKDLLASDIETGKSDPICFFSIQNKENLVIDWENESNILSSDVKKCTITPKWNSEHTFPFILHNVDELLKANIYMIVRDEDILEDGSISYDNLGQVFYNLFSLISLIC